MGVYESKSIRRICSFAPDRDSFQFEMICPVVFWNGSSKGVRSLSATVYLNEHEKQQPLRENAT